MQTDTRKLPQALLVFLFSIYLATGIMWGIIFPLGESPDEPAHFMYVRYVAQKWSLPVMRPVLLDNETGEAFQAPAYYVLAALLTFPLTKERPNLGQNPAFLSFSQVPRVPLFFSLPEHRFPWQGIYLAWHVTRLVSLALGALNLWVVWRTALLVFRDRWLSVATVAYLALNPQFIYLHSMVTNDALAAVMGSLITFTALVLLRAPTLRNVMMAALVITLAALSKPSALTLGPGLVCALVKAWLAFSSWRKRWLTLGILLTVPMLFGGWWFGRNFLLYGDWLGLSVAKQALAANYYPEPLSLRQLIGLLPDMFRQTFQSSWGFFGWLAFPLSNWVFKVILFFHLIGLIGLVLSKPMPLLRSIGIVLTISWMGLILGFLYYNMTTNSSGWHGRFLFPGGSIAAIALVAGWRHWLGRWPAVLASLATVLGVLLICCALVQVIFPIYFPPRFLPLDTAVPHRLDVNLAGGLQLVGYDVRPTTIDAGDRLQVTLYWRKITKTDKQYRFLINGHTIDGRLTVHGTESFLPWRYPIAIWPDDRIVIDRFQVSPVAEMSQAMAFLEVQVWDGYQHAQIVSPVDDVGKPSAQSISLGQVAIGGGVPPEKLPTNINARFGKNEVRLLGYAPDAPCVEPGTTLQVALYWKAVRRPEKDYHVFVQLIGPDGQLVTQHDGSPRMGVYPMTAWQPGEVVVDIHPVPIPQGQPDTVHLFVGLYELESMERLPVMGAHGETYTHQALPLAEISICGKDSP